MLIRNRLALAVGSPRDLARYVSAQLHNMFPASGEDRDLQVIMEVISGALERMRPILAAVRSFSPEVFNHFNSLQYATFLYLLGNELWRADPTEVTADRLFCLNRTLNAMDLFCSVDMPEIFLIAHGVGAVVGNATYGNRFIFFQNVTVGRIGDRRPTIGANTILFPGVTVTGGAYIGDNCVISSGVVVHNSQVPDSVVVTSGPSGLIFRPLKRDYLSLYMRCEH